MDVIAEGINEDGPLAMLFLDNLFLCDSNKERLERKILEIWRDKIKAAGLKISRKETAHSPAVGDQKNIRMKSVVVWLYKACLSVLNSSTWAQKFTKREEAVGGRLS